MARNGMLERAAGRLVMVLGVIGAMAVTEVSAQDLGKLKFMEGCWRAEPDDKTVVEEHWTSPSDNLMMAVTRYLTKGVATNWEFTRIEKSDSLTAFIAQSMGEAPDTFRLKNLVDEVVIWENPRKDFPKRIMYRRTSDGNMIVRLEDDSPAGERDFEMKVQRVKCPGK
jgi:hypothetical protein